MRPELKAKFISYFNRRQGEKGFTLVELLVVIIIIGILAAIALPNFLNQASKAKQSEGKQNIALVNKAQSSYRAENSAFATSFDTLAIGSITGAGVTGSTVNFIYTIGGSTDAADIAGQAKDPALKGYAGRAVLYSNSVSQSVIGTVICEAQSPGTGAPALSTTTGAPPVCDPTENTLSL